MARMPKMDLCPNCGVTIAPSLAKSIRTREEGYICPETSTQQMTRVQFEKEWQKDLSEKSDSRA